VPLKEALYIIQNLGKRSKVSFSGVCFYNPNECQYQIHGVVDKIYFTIKNLQNRI